MTQDEVLRLLKARADFCFMCRWALEDLTKNAKLTGYPTDAMGAGIFPADGKRQHILLEARSFDNRSSVATMGA